MNEICPTCSLDAHEGDCTAAVRCRNCNGSHPAYSRKCPAFVKEQEIIAFKTHNNLSYAEAKREILNRYVEPDLAYSQAVTSVPQTVGHISAPRQATNQPPTKISQQKQTTAAQPNLKPQPIFYQTVDQMPPTSQSQKLNTSSQSTKDHNHRPNQKDDNNNQPTEEDRSRKPQKTTQSSNSRPPSSKRQMEHKDSSLERYPKRNNDKSFPIQMNIPSNLPNQNKHPP